MLEVRLVEDGRSTIGLHPHMSVVSGLSPDARALLVRALPDLLRGVDCGVLATVEVDGRMDELGPGCGPSPLQGLSGADTLVRPDDLLQSLAAGPRRGTGGGETASPDTHQLAGVTARNAAARASLLALGQAVDAARNKHLAARDARIRAESAVSEARRDLDPYGVAALETALSAASRVEVQLGLSRGACRADTLESVKERIVLLEGQLRDMSTALEMLAAADPESVAQALDAVRVVTATGPIAPPEAIRLADEWLALREHLAALEAKIAAEDGGVQAVSDRLDAARTRLAACQDALMPQPVSQDDVRRLETAHEAVLAAERKANSRLGGAKARAALDIACKAEQTVLDQLGYPTWSAWIMGARMLDSTAERGRQYEQARRELDEAAYAWESLSARLESDPEFCALLDRLEHVLEAAHALVGEVDDVEGALRRLRVDPGPPPCSVAEARQWLAGALAGAGLEVEPDANLDGLRLHAERWLARIRAVGSLRRQIEIDREHCASELEVARENYDRIDALGPIDAGDGYGSARLAEARVAIIEAEQRVNRHRSALSRVAHLIAEAGGLAELERQLAVAREAMEELHAVTLDLETATAAKLAALGSPSRDATADKGAAEPLPGSDGDVDALIDHIDQRMQHTRALVGDCVPFIFDDSLRGLDPAQSELVLRWLVSASDHTQIVYVTDDPAVVAWAARRSPEYVAVLHGRGFFG